MNLLKYTPFFILIYFSLRLLSKFIEENIISLKEQISDEKIERGILSIKDLQKNNYDRFLKAIKFYLCTHNYENIIIFKDNIPELTNLKGILNGDNVYITCIQNIMENDSNNENLSTLTTKKDIESFLGRMITNDCKRGLFINNTSYSNGVCDFVRVLNSSSNFEIKLIDGYELTKSIRLYKNCNIELEVSNEF